MFHMSSQVERKFTVVLKDFSHKPTGPLPDSSVKREYFELSVGGNHWTNAYASAAYYREFAQAITIDGVLHLLDTTQCVSHGPGVSWEVNEDTPIADIMLIEMGHALTRDNVSGISADRFVYTIFWQAMKKSEYFREWVAELAPEWYKLVEGCFT
jgi:hypothetical protein